MTAPVLDIPRRARLGSRLALPLIVFGGTAAALVGFPAWLRAVGAIALIAPLLWVLLVEPEPTYFVWLTSAAAFSIPLSQLGVGLGVRVYGTDALLLLAGLAAATIAAAGRSRVRPQTLVVVGALLIFGFFETVRGVLAGHDPADIFGTLRRMFLYPLLAFLFAHTLLRTPRGLRIVTLALWIGCAIIVLEFLLRLLTGTGYASDVFESSNDVTRYLSYAEVPTLATGASLALAHWALRLRTASRFWWLVLAGGLTIVVIASNYRTAWLALFAALLATSAALSIRTPGRALTLLVSGSVAAVAGGAIVIASPLGIMLAEKLSRVNLLQTGSWRVFSWLRAWEVFRTDQVLGVGLGYHHVFAHLGGDLHSFTMSSTHEIHNDWLWILVNTGIAGLVAILVPSFALLIRGLRSIRIGTDQQNVAVLVAAYGGIAAYAVTASLQPTLSLGGTAVWLGAFGAMLSESTAIVEAQR